MLSGKKTVEALDRMEVMFPDAKGELDHESPFQYLIAVILSAQATDVSVNKATPSLFSAYPTAETLARAPLEDVMSRIKTIGLYKNKAKNIIKTAQLLVNEYEGKVPETIEEMVKLPGVGKKTANVVAGDAFGVPAIAVDTHVERVAKRLRICKQSASVVEVEEVLMKKIPKERWIQAHHTIILFGRYHCVARKPKCEGCPLLDMCVEGQRNV
ncbi:endonuclease III [Vagococcus hydrophili]|uniref:Endonuclease III n=1 Tax=Vagococcus hydrophili TaxID=2714947 RepID=A0A6G8AVG8_9ENTE|nr:endonuclease III [Vagococcus hydrophili]QIL48980.1 endonuclease III [Vagococcus hydrophili]